VEEIAKDKKVITLKVRRRKNSQNIKGFRRQVTILRIREIILSNETAGDMGVV
jgi:ribosomal protein L21